MLRSPHQDPDSSARVGIWPYAGGHGREEQAHSEGLAEVRDDGKRDVPDAHVCQQLCI